MNPGTVTDTSERGLEDLIVAAMTASAERSEGVASAHGLYGSGGWILGDWHDYEREYAVDLRQLAFQSTERLFRPSQIHYAQAIAIAAVGLAVNLLCAWWLASRNGSTSSPRT